MKTAHQLTKEINDLTLFLESEHPEIYRFLDEDPITIPSEDHPKVDIAELENYLESLHKLIPKDKVEVPHQELLDVKRTHDLRLN